MLKLSLAFAATAAVAGYLPTQLLIGAPTKKTVLVVGGAATLAAWGVVALGAPYFVGVTVDGSTVYPVWAVLLGFPAAGIWRWFEGAAPGRKSEAERVEEIREKARERARRHARGDG